MRQRTLSTRTQSSISCSAGIGSLAPAVRSSTARRARPCQARPARRPPSELDDARPSLDRPSTVLPSRDAVPILGMGTAHASRELIFPPLKWAAGDALSPGSALRGSGRHPHGRKPRQRVPSRGRLRPRDSTRPEPGGRGGRPKRGRHSAYLPGRVSTGSMGRASARSMYHRSPTPRAVGRHGKGVPRADSPKRPLRSMPGRRRAPSPAGSRGPTHLPLAACTKAASSALKRRVSSQNGAWPRPS